MDTVIILDFETTGLYPSSGDRPTEVAAVVVRDGRIKSSYHSLINAGVRLSPFIQEFTGITNKMIEKAPPVRDVMQELVGFMGTHPIVAHNASFDRLFLDEELKRIRRVRRQEMLCSMLLARRVYPNAPNHKLETLARYVRIPNKGRAHRALADATTTAELWIRMIQKLTEEHGLDNVPIELMQKLQTVQRAAIARFLTQYRSGRNVSSKMDV
jgi:DNA polymerase III subunit epsilon